jgi:hypothetical protein
MGISSAYSQFLFNSQHTSDIDMKRLMMVSRNLQDDDEHSVKRHNDPPPADVGDIIAAATN